MEKKLQVVIEQLAPLMACVDNKPDDVSYSFNIFNAKQTLITFTANLWVGYDIINSHRVEFCRHDSSIAITRKIKEIKEILRGKVNPFEEEK